MLNTTQKHATFVMVGRQTRKKPNWSMHFLIKEIAPTFSPTKNHQIINKTQVSKFLLLTSLIVSEILISTQIDPSTLRRLP
jgi:hypothetical protein